MKGEPIDRLKAAIRDGKAVVVCGAGVSAAATKGTAPTWERLIRDGIEQVAKQGKANTKWMRAQNAQLKTKELQSWLQVADQIAYKLGERGLERWLRRTLGSLRIEDSRLLDAIKALKIPIVTLNYDGLLYKATGYRPITWREPNAIVATLNDPTHGIIHLHGYWEQPDTCVFGSHSYRDATSFTKTQFLQQAMFLNGSLVFIGCGATGFNDPNLGPLNEWFDENWAGLSREHYWLCRTGESTDGLPSHIVPIRYGAAYDEMPAFVESLASIVSAGSAATLSKDVGCHVAIDRLPLTRYVNLVGRDDALAKISDAWRNEKIRILSLVAEGGAGKTALVNGWLTEFREQGYGDAAAVLGWSFYSQGSKERATSAEPFLNWACQELKLTPASESPTARAELIADALKSRPIILVLDGVEPLQHGPEAGLTGILKDSGLATLLKRHAAVSGPRKGFVLLTSRLPVTDLKNYASTSAPIIELNHLAEKDGAKLLRDNGVIGSQFDLEAASKNFVGHALSLTLLAAYLVECQEGDIRRRDHIRSVVEDEENPGHDHATRVIESYDREWLGKEPALASIMRLVGLFDRPASEDCLEALRRKPQINNLTSSIVGLPDAVWNRAIKRLRDVRLLLPADRRNPGALDAHPLVREWFGKRLKSESESAWRHAHSRLYDHLTEATKESDWPSLEELLPLYQAISHGCRANRHQEALDDVYAARLCRRDSNGLLRFHTAFYLGAYSADIAALSWFFDEPFSRPATAISDNDREWILGEAGAALRALGRLREAAEAYEAQAKLTYARAAVAEGKFTNREAATAAVNLSETCLITGNIRRAIESAEIAVTFARKIGGQYPVGYEAALAVALLTSGNAAMLINVFTVHRRWSSFLPVYHYCDFLLDQNDIESASKWSNFSIGGRGSAGRAFEVALQTLVSGRVVHNLARRAGSTDQRRGLTRKAWQVMAEAIARFRKAGEIQRTPHGLLARSALALSCGDWSKAEEDLDETRDIVEAEMPLFLCDQHLVRARLAFARIEAFAPLNDACDDIAEPQPPTPAETEVLRAEAERNLAAAASLIAKHGYHGRDEELTELQDVLAGRRRYADLRPRV